MSVSVSTPDIEKAKLILQELSLPPEIRSVDAESGVDSTGSPALWITFQLKVGVVNKRSDLKKITDYMDSVQTKLIHSEVGAFPYLRLEEAA